jgi:hypothetical protein
LDQYGVGTCLSDLDNQPLDSLHFTWKDECVKSDVALDASAMEQCHHIGQCFHLKIRRARSCVETAVEAEVDSVRSIFDCGSDAFDVSCWGE